MKQTTQQMSLFLGMMRNLIDFDQYELPTNFGLIGEQQGYFPIDSYQKIYLEIPRNNQKLDLSGRKNTYFTLPSTNQKWVERRIVNLPQYLEKDRISIEEIGRIIKIWDSSLIPEEIPLFIVSTVIKGDYSSDLRLAQLAAVLVIYPNYTARVLELDWYEGPQDDCITPEWYIRTSELLTISHAISLLIKYHQKRTRLGNPQYILSTIPSNLEFHYQGSHRQNSSDLWKLEYVYQDYSEFYPDLIDLLDQFSTTITEEVH